MKIVLKDSLKSWPAFGWAMQVRDLTALSYPGCDPPHPGRDRLILAVARLILAVTRLVSAVTRLVLAVTALPWP
eukprot:3244925-Rhodomonas_salina.2